MSIRQIKKLSMNEHYYALMLQCFLTGYGRPCHLKMAFMSLPILMYSESREKLKTANKASRIDTVFSSKQQVQGADISGRERLSGAKNRGCTAIVQHAPLAIHPPAVGGVESKQRAEYGHPHDYPPLEKERHD